jgi:hypothetical protein
METARHPYARVEALEDRKDGLDRVADQIVLADKFVPFDHCAIAERRLCDAGDNRHLAQEVVGSRLVAAARGMHHGHRILHGDRLRSSRLDIDFGSPEARQDQGGPAMDQMAAVEFRRDVDGQVQIAQRRLRRLPIGNGGGEIAADREKHLHFAPDHRFQPGDDVMSRLLRRLKAETVFQALEKVRLGNLRDADSPVALHVGMAANRTNAGAFAPDIAAKQRQIGNLLYVMRAALVLRNAHAVDQDGAFRLHVGIGSIFEILARQAGLALDVGPLGALEIFDERLDTDRVAVDEIPIEDRRLVRCARSCIRLHQDLHHALEGRDIAADANLKQL